ncbi:ankyrin repeat domain-containing protein [Skeletonema marinoi]|uniref:Ankyrin repeat domain-containing protein n=1 Tax=Skeletonema marinoi TaxID=267567 RepID=A0AAD8YGZ4_9STRA|nr:ankyrin repeat domain-containing protein [Skeletonema marinoi]
MERQISCCQNSSTCSRPLQQWLLQSPTFCRHNSNCLFGAIRENDVDLVKYIARQMGDEVMTELLTTHETAFGDTCLGFAASLGRLDIVTLFLDEIKRIASNSEVKVAMSDLVNRETSRGKIAIIEAIKCGKVDVVSTLLSNAASVKLPSKTHGKSALDWAIIGKNEAMLAMINQHLQLSEHITSLFKAISNRDKKAVVSLTEGGTPHTPHSTPLSDRLETLRSQIEQEKQKSCELSQLFSQEKPKLDAAISEREIRVKAIDDMRSERQDMVTKRRRDFIEVVAVLKLAATESNIAALSNTESPLECELIAKALCTLFCIKINEQASGSGAPFFQKILSMMRDKHNFLHRVKHYQLVPSQAKLAASVQVDGIPGTCSDYISVSDESASLGALMNSIARYLSTLFDQITIHEHERSLLMKQRAEDDMLQRNTTDMEVLKSRCAILRRELRVTMDSYRTLQQKLNKLQRENVVASVMNAKALNGHTVLSWAAAVGNIDIVKVLLKHGANTGIEERCVCTSVIIIQAAYRHYFWRRGRHDNEDLEQRERERCVNLRIRTLSRSVRDHLQSIHLPLAEALFNGNTEVASLLDKADISLFQAINLLHLFQGPCSTPPRPLTSPTLRVESNFEDMLSSIILAGNVFSEEEELRNCPYVASLKFASSTIDAFLQYRKHSLEKKISSRRDTLFQNHRKEKIIELTSAMHKSNFEGMIKASEEACIPLDHEDSVGMTPLIRAVIVGSTTQNRYKRRPGGKEMSAVTYLLGRVSHLSPTVDYENRLGHTAMSMACSYSNGGMETIRDLLQGGADINRQSSLDGNTPLHHACKAGNLDVVAELIRCGANHTLKNHLNHTATDFVEGSVADYLQSLKRSEEGSMHNDSK